MSQFGNVEEGEGMGFSRRGPDNQNNNRPVNFEGFNPEENLQFRNPNNLVNRRMNFPQANFGIGKRNCREFERLGVCQYGENCHFIHRRIMDVQNPRSADPKIRRPCGNIPNCIYGYKCKFIHSQSYPPQPLHHRGRNSFNNNNHNNNNHHHHNHQPPPHPPYSHNNHHQHNLRYVENSSSTQQHVYPLTQGVRGGGGGGGGFMIPNNIPTPTKTNLIPPPSPQQLHLQQQQQQHGNNNNNNNNNNSHHHHNHSFHDNSQKRVIVLVGAYGSGCSTLCNVLLWSNMFTEGTRRIPFVNPEFEIRVNENIIVVDTEGIAQKKEKKEKETTNDDEEEEKEKKKKKDNKEEEEEEDNDDDEDDDKKQQETLLKLANVLECCENRYNGINGILFVTNGDEKSMDFNTIALLKKMLGKGFFNRFLVVRTHFGDKITNGEEVINEKNRINNLFQTKMWFSLETNNIVVIDNPPTTTTTSTTNNNNNNNESGLADTHHTRNNINKKISQTQKWYDYRNYSRENVVARINDIAISRFSLRFDRNFCSKVVMKRTIDRNIFEQMRQIEQHNNNNKRRGGNNNEGNNEQQFTQQQQLYIQDIKKKKEENEKRREILKDTISKSLKEIIFGREDKED